MKRGPKPVHTVITKEQHESRKQKSREACRRWKARNPGKRKQYYQDYDNLRYYDRLPQKMFISARMRAEKAGIPFEIEHTDIVIPVNCPVCKEEIKSAKGIRGGSRNSPTLDRVHNHKGYVKGNVAVICKNCNSKKGHSSREDLMNLVDYMDNY